MWLCRSGQMLGGNSEENGHVVSYGYGSVSLRLSGKYEGTRKFGQRAADDGEMPSGSPLAGASALPTK